MGHRGKISLMGRIKRSGMRKVVKVASRYDFVDLTRRIGNSEVGQPWLEHFENLEPAWPQQDELAEKAVELTMDQLQADGRQAQVSDIRRLMADVRCIYDYEVHNAVMPAVTVLMNGFFSQPDPLRPFVSPDARELAHVDELKAHRENGLGVVYLANHSSHLDEFLVDCLLANNDLGLPLIAAGANMMAIKGLARIFRSASYVVQRRGASRQALSCLFNYCRAISETGGQQGVFLEAWHGGARSRDGSLRYPRRLVTLRGALAAENDVVIQPMALSYAIVPEDLSLAAHAGAGVWTRGMGLWSTLGRMAIHPRSWMWRSIQGLYGRAYVTLPKPHLLSELKELHAAERKDLSLDEFVALTSIRDIARAKKVMASHLTARGLMRARREGSSRLAEAVEAERQDMTEYHLATYGAEPDFEDLITDGTTNQVVTDGLATLRKRRVLARMSRDDLGLPVVSHQLGLAFYATHGDRRLYSPTAKKNAVVAGSGDWGFGLTHALGHRLLEDRSPGHSLTLYEPLEDLAQSLAINRRPEGEFSEVRLPKNAFVTWDAPQAFKKATVAVLACSPAHLADQAQSLLEHSEQNLKVVVACCGLLPDGSGLPVNLVTEMAASMGRSGVEVFSLVGPVTSKELIENLSTTAVLAGPEAGRKELVNLFSRQSLTILQSLDATGVQASAILARVYALWGNLLSRLGEVKTAAQTGYYMAAAQKEAAILGQALGGDDRSFFGPSWTATFVAEGLSGPTREMGRRLGKALNKKGQAASEAAKIYQQQTEAGIKLPAYPDLELAARLAREKNLDMPLLLRAADTIWPV